MYYKLLLYYNRNFPFQVLYETARPDYIYIKRHPDLIIIATKLNNQFNHCTYFELVCIFLIMIHPLAPTDELVVREEERTR